MEYDSEGLGGVWEKVSRILEEGLRSGKEELLRTSRVGYLRLEIKNLRRQHDKKLKQLGEELYRLWQGKRINLPQMEPLLREIQGVTSEIKDHESLVEEVLAEREAALAEAEVTGMEPGLETGIPSLRHKKTKRRPLPNGSLKK